MSKVQGYIKEGVNNKRPNVARGDYDFAVDGGAVSTIPLIGGTLIPLGATILYGWIEVVTALTSGGSATAAIQVEGAGDIVPAQVLATWTTGRKKIVPCLGASAVLAAATDVRLTADRDISLVIAVAALTAGKFSVILEYLDPLG